MSSNILTSRSQMRKDINQKRLLIDKNTTERVSYKIFEKLIHHPYLKKAITVGSYNSFKNEIDMVHINSYLKENGHNLVLPTIDFNKKGHMDFFSFKSFDALIKNRYGIFEPQPLDTNLIDPSSIDILLVPLLAFDEKGNRLGMGGGFYDRMLKRISKDTLTIGIAYEFQKFDTIPIQSWDMPLDEVITEKKHYIFNKKT